MAENVVTTNEPIEAVRAQRDALLEQVVELEESLQAKQVENEKLGSRVTNLELDVQRRDKEITRLKGQVDDGALTRALKSDLAFAQNEVKRYQSDYTNARKEIVALNIQLQQAVALKADVTADEARAEVVKLRNEKAEVEAKLQAVSSERDRLQRSLGGAPAPVASASAPPPDWMVIAGERDEAKAEVEQWKRRTEDAFVDRDKFKAEVERLRSAGTAVVAQLTPTCPLPHAIRRKVPDESRSDTVKVRIGTQEPEFCDKCQQRIWKPGDRTEAYIHTCHYPDDNSLGAVFVSLESLRNGELASVGFAMLGQILSVAMQYGAPAKKLIEKLLHQHDECSGRMLVEVDGKVIPHPSFGFVNGFTDAIARVMMKAAGLTDEDFR